MKNLLSIVAAFLVFTTVIATTNCAHGTIPAPIVDFGQCLNGEMSKQVQEILAEVEVDVATSSYLELLTDLAKRTSFAAVDCAVLEVKKRTNAQMIASPSDQLTKDKSAHSTAWLTRK